MRVAYIVNVYPAVSHSFIRREIAALERLGVEVRRYSIRRSLTPLPDPQDQSELALTSVVPIQSAIVLITAGFTALLRNPIRLARCLARVLEMTPSGPRRLLRAVAYVIEACWIAKSIRHNQVEHLHAHFGTNSATVAWIAASLAGIPYSFTVHGPEEFDAAHALGLATKIENAAFVVAISFFGRSQLLRLLGPESWCKVHVVRCGLELQALPQTANNESTTQYDFCYVGRLAPQKGLPTLAEAIDLLGDQGLDFTMCMIGDGELRDWLETFLDKRHLAQSVSLLGSKSEKDVFNAMCNSKVVIVPSYAEGLPVVLMEAFVNRRPVVSTYVAGIPELVTTNAGILVPAGDAVALAEALIAACQLSDQERLAMGQAGYERVRRLHDIDRNAAQLLSLFRSGGKSSGVT